MNFMDKALVILTLACHVVLIGAISETLFRVELQAQACEYKVNCEFITKSKTFIKVNGKNLINPTNLGWHIVTYDHYTRRVLEVRNFNTHKFSYHSNLMASFLRYNVYTGVMVFGVSHGDSGEQFTNAAMREVVSLCGKGFKMVSYSARLFVGYRNSRYFYPAFNFRMVKEEAWGAGGKPGGLAYHRAFANQRANWQKAFLIDAKSMSVLCVDGRCASESYIRIYAKGTVPVIMTGYPGINLAVLHPVTAKLEHSKNFKTLVSKSMSDAMADFLNKLPPGKIVVGVADYTYADHMTEKAKKALLAITRIPHDYVFIGEWAFVGYTGPDEIFPKLPVSLGTKGIGGNKYPVYLTYSFGLYQDGNGCLLPRAPGNGKKILSKNRYLDGDVVKFACNDNYILQGASQAKCTASHEHEYIGGAKPDCVYDIDECLNGKAKCQPNTNCVNIINSYKCECKKGFKEINKKCIDINECQNPILYSCPRLSDCINTAGAYKCQCHKGYKMENRNCIDIDECAVPGSCPQNSKCSNQKATYSCTCNKGYSKKGNLCVDINECSDVSLYTCPANSQCLNEPGAYSCKCNKGYKKDKNLCIDVDECADKSLYTCPTFSHCVNEAGGYRCDCNQGYKKENGKCNDIDECTDASLFNCPANSQCVNEPGKYSCKCNNGYKKDKNTCIDVDECADQSLYTCPSFSRCANEVGGYKCNCNKGYKKDKDQCVDINECNDVSLYTCPANSQCVNEPGGYSCKCDNGYKKDKNKCVDVDECADNSLYTCKPFSHCENEIGSYRCVCNQGYKKDNDKCVDIDECQDKSLHTCKANSHCVNKPGQYACVCDNGYEESGNACKDIDECADASLHTCPRDSQCVNEPGIYHCKCNKGYTKDKAKCVDVNECDYPNIYSCREHSNCVNVIGSYNCRCGLAYKDENGVCIKLDGCDKGFIRSSKKDCEDIDECAHPSIYSCPKNSNCKNYQGGFSCDCEKGFVKDGKQCKDINECERPDLHSCPKPNSGCVNTPGTYTCECKTGFKDESGNCVDINECTAGKPPCFENEYCINLNGSYECRCKEGYDGTAGKCKDIDECKAGVFKCSSGSICMNSIGSYKCSKCKLGFSTNNKQTECIDVDECTLEKFDCEENYKCRNTAGSYVCECGKGFIEKSGNCSATNITITESTNMEIKVQSFDGSGDITILIERISVRYALKGFEGEKAAQNDINECIDDKNACPSNSKCANFIGGHNCTCNAGFLLSKESCVKPKKKTDLAIIIASVVAGLIVLGISTGAAIIVKRRSQGKKFLPSLNGEHQDYKEVATYEMETGHCEVIHEDDNVRNDDADMR